ncbi:DNA polymerase epsilon subunit 4-like [Pteronotus mesoamericanus]|uniref:DNA polymerase epsilon subunit 4-like n=1 Tax=Pteronotus mesoamericanus TaxID=1884717 RepID=UPI0023EA7996|nr:DNA polymerase epsilon subunit 4-like [Pteronotus parnellii mesoamericanus]
MAAGTTGPLRRRGPAERQQQPRRPSHRGVSPQACTQAHLSKLSPSPVKALVNVYPVVWNFLWRLFARDAYCCAQQGKKKTLQRRDLDNAIDAVWKNLIFWEVL